MSIKTITIHKKNRNYMKSHGDGWIHTVAVAAGMTGLIFVRNKIERPFLFISSCKYIDMNIQIAIWGSCNSTSKKARVSPGFNLVIITIIIIVQFVIVFNLRLQFRAIEFMPLLFQTLVLRENKRLLITIHQKMMKIIVFQRFGNLPITPIKLNHTNSR